MNPFTTSDGAVINLNQVVRVYRTTKGLGGDFRNDADCEASVEFVNERTQSISIEDFERLKKHIAPVYEHL